MCHCWLDNDAKGSIKHEPDILENFLSCSRTFHTLTDLMPIRTEMREISSKRARKNCLRDSCKLSLEEQYTKKPQHYCKSATTLASAIKKFLHFIIIWEQGSGKLTVCPLLPTRLHHSGRTGKEGGLKLSFQQTPSISIAHPSVFLSLSFLQGACVLSTARQNLPLRLLTAELQAGETERVREKERQKERERIGRQGEL